MRISFVKREVMYQLDETKRGRTYPTSDTDRSKDLTYCINVKTQAL